MRPPLISGDTLSESLTHHAGHAPDAVAVFPATGDRITARELDEAATRCAHALLDAGIGPGDVVGVLVPTTSRFLTALFGVLRTGAAASVLPGPASLGSGSTPAKRIAAIADTARMRHLVLDESYADIGAMLGQLRPDLRIVTPSQSTAVGARSLPTISPDDLAIVQFTSGSTSAPKGVMLPHRTVMAGLRACVHSGHFSPDDVFVQWVPTFHDMGLIGLLSHLLNGADVHAFPPSKFLRRPREVVAYFAEHKGTVLTGPNFSYDHLLDSVDPEFVASLDLSSWRLAFNGAEPVRAETVARFAEVLAPAGVRDAVMYPAYGMAEATLSITYPEPGSVPSVVTVDRTALGDGKITLVDADDRSAKALVALGKPVVGMEIRIIDPSGDECGEGRLGEIHISGAAVTTGYYLAPELTADAFDGTWFRTGDLGFQLDGQLYIGGRAKDVMILRGANHFPEDVEAVARETPGVYRGHCVAFAETDDRADEHIAVVVEGDPRGPDPDGLAAEVARRVAAELDLAEIRVHVVRPNWLTRTTSGKWQRGAARTRLAEQAVAEPSRP
ncbi:MAG: AMP-binding protein [Actinomycetota bacterium]|nr:AMP-binding protein [Actinomycetota bacterium]